MRVAFVGVKRKYQELPPDYRDSFDRFHLELPFYYARDGANVVNITTVDYTGPWRHFPSGGSLRCEKESEFGRSSPEGYDVVVHWRKWFPELYRPEAINVINCQDHSFSPEWIRSASYAIAEKKLFGILCFPKWHKQNLIAETGFSEERCFDGVTLGVDTDIFKPDKEKDPFQMLWASDPGRGINTCLELAIRLFQVDRRFKLHVCYPDYVQNAIPVRHPAIEWHGNVGNGPKLWDLFNKTGVLPYTSNFKEPSSRAHRQAQAAGSLVLYPPGMGTPSELIEVPFTGIVAPINQWVDKICYLVGSGKWAEIGRAARERAVSEDWPVQARRFNQLFERLVQDKRRATG